MLRLFDKTEREYTVSNGDIVIKALKAKVRKEDNGDFYLTFECDLSYADYLEEDKIIVADTPQGAQAFRVNNLEKRRTKLSCKAMHVFYDSQNYLIADSYVVDMNCVDALNHLNDATEPKSPFICNSDISTIKSFRCVRKSFYEAIQTVLERWGGHLVRDNFNISIMNEIGVDNEVTIRYRKNLRNIVCKEDWNGVVTKLLPVGKDGVLLPEKYVISAVQYELPYTKTVSFTQDIDRDDYASDEAYEAALIADLRTQAQAYVDTACLPLVNYTISANLEKITDIGDVVQVIDERLGVNVMTNVIAYEYDCILKRYTSVEFGNERRTLAGLINLTTQIATQQAQRATEVLAADIAEIGYLKAEDAEINYAKIDLANVNNAWIQNGVIKDAAISDAQIIGVSANKLTAGEIDASKIIVSNLNAANITTGRLTVGGLTIDVEESEARLNGGSIEDGTITLSGLAQEVTDKIDGAIETFTGNAIPTLNNYPASSWATAKVRSTHVGDVYYVVNAASQADGYCYRFAYDNTTSTYGWVLIKDSDVTKALQELLDVQGDIDGLQSFETETNSWITNTDDELSSLKIRTSTLEISNTAINLLPSLYYQEGANGKNPWTSNGITWTVNTDGSVTAKGTATADSSFYFSGNTLAQKVPVIVIDPDKRYTLSGCPSGGSSTTYFMRGRFTPEGITPTSSSGALTSLDTGSGVTTHDPQKYAWIFATIKSGYTTPTDGLTFYPMLEAGTKAHNYVSTHNGTEALRVQVSTKVETSVFNEVKQTVDENSASITSLSTRVDTKADNSTVTTLSNTVNTVKQTADANKTSISNLTTTVNNKADSSTVSATVSEINQTMQSLGLAVGSSYNSTTKTFSDVQLGGVQLLPDTNVNSMAAVDGTVTRYLSDTTRTDITGEFFELSDAPVGGLKYGYRLKCTSSTNAYGRDLAWRNTETYINLIAGETYTMSVYARLTSGSEGRLRQRVYNGTSYKVKYHEVTNTTWKQYAYTFVWEPGSSDRPVLYPGGVYNEYACTLELCGFKLEKGNKATDWSEIPQAFINLETRMKNAELKITDEAIISTVSSTYSTKTEAQGYANTAESNAKADTVEKLKSYSTTTQMNSAIEQKANSITQTVSETYQTVANSAVVNLLPSVYYRENLSGNKWTNNGITWILNKDGSVTATGTATANSLYYFSGTTLDTDVPALTLDSDKRYTLSGCPAGGSSTTYEIGARCTAEGTTPTTSSGSLIHDYGNGVSTTTARKYFLVYAVVRNGYTCPTDGLTFYPMLEVGTVKNGYMSTHEGTGALNNRVYTAESNITQLSDEIDLTVESIGNRNLVPFPYYRYAATGNTYTINGITYTLNTADNTVSATGTATGSAYYHFTNNKNTTYANGQFYLSAGTYTLSGCPSGGSNSKWRLEVNLFSNNTDDTKPGITPTKHGTVGAVLANAAIDYGEGVTFTINSGYYARIEAIVFTGAGAVSNLVFKPMLENGYYKHDYVNPALGAKNLVSEINLTPDAVTINADKININGVVSANSRFKINTDGSFETIKGKIGGWNIEPTYLAYGTWGSANGLLLCPTGSGSAKSIGGSDSINGWTITSGANFGVTKTGALYAKDAVISGKITSSNATITGGSIQMESTENDSTINLYYNVSTAAGYNTIINGRGLDTKTFLRGVQQYRIYAFANRVQVEDSVDKVVAGITPYDFSIVPDYGSGVVHLFAAKDSSTGYYYGYLSLGVPTGQNTSKDNIIMNGATGSIQGSSFVDLNNNSIDTVTGFGTISRTWSLSDVGTWINANYNKNHHVGWIYCRANPSGSDGPWGASSFSVMANCSSENYGWAILQSDNPNGASSIIIGRNNAGWTWSVLKSASIVSSKVASNIDGVSMLYWGTFWSTTASSIANGYGKYSTYIIAYNNYASNTYLYVEVPKPFVGSSASNTYTIGLGSDANYGSMQMYYSGNTLYFKGVTRSGSNVNIRGIYGVY